MGKKMTKPQQRVALDMILTQDGHGGMSPEALLLHEKQAEDAERMDKRMSEIEKKLEYVEYLYGDQVDSLDKKVDTLDEKIDEIKTLIDKQSSIKQSLKEIFSNKIFIYLLLCFIAIKFGLPIADLGTFLFK